MAVERGLFYQALNVVPEVFLDDDLELEDYVVNFRRMVGNPSMDAVLGSVDDSLRFFGLTPNQYEAGGARQALPPDRQLQKMHMVWGNVAGNMSEN